MEYLLKSYKEHRRENTGGGRKKDKYQYVQEEYAFKQLQAGKT